MSQRIEGENICVTHSNIPHDLDLYHLDVGLIMMLSSDHIYVVMTKRK